MNEDRRYRLDLREPTRTDPGFVVLVAWIGVAGFAVLLALVAVIYGVPGRNSVVAARPGQIVDPVTTGSVGSSRDFSRLPDFPGDGGESQIAGTMPADGPSSADVARLKIENSALRQALQQMRSSMDMLSERVEKLEGKLADTTGSLGGQERSAIAPRLAEAPPVPGELVDGTVEPAPRPTTQFGVELGTYSDLTAVKAAWRTLRQDHPGLFTGMAALATVRDRGGKTELLLVAGPFSTAPDAADYCGKAETQGVGCLPAFYVGQPLAME